MTKFDPIRAQREIVNGIISTHQVIVTLARNAEQRYTEAEGEFNSLKKIEQFSKNHLAQEQQKLQRLVEEAEGR